MKRFEDLLPINFVYIYYKNIFYYFKYIIGCFIFFNPIPKYSILYYNSNYNKDFKGGTIEFINDQTIKPTKNMCLFFDSNLGHRVNLQTSGERECILILFFDR